jgi:5-(carboxyamino)imidazole ribonucleotide synthase
MSVAAGVAEMPQPVATPSARVGMVGAGQLARMTQQAAIGLGIELAVLTDDALAPAVRAGARQIHGSAGDARDLLTLAEGCDVVTFDHEQADPALLGALAEHAVVRPSPAAQLMAQDKLEARRVLADSGFPVPAFVAVESPGDIERFAAAHGWPVMAKSRTGGYDGRGVWVLDGPEQARDLYDRLRAAGRALLVEELVDLECELAVLVARNPRGQVVCYPVFQTHQHDGICHEVIAPAPVGAELADSAQRLAVSVADGVDAAGVIAVELFVAGGKLLVNELALRPHNSGHLTIDACHTSQFEQHLRGVLNWPLGRGELAAPACAMVNVLGPANPGDPAAGLAAALEVPHAHVHLYGKPWRPGRKLGHVTALGDDVDEALQRARAAAAAMVAA